MNKSIIVFPALLIAGFAGNALAGQVTCASNDSKYKECRLEGSGDIVMKTQLSKTDCVKNQTWGETDSGVYVKGGCRAIFETMSMNPQPSMGAGGGALAGQVTCASSDGKYKECPLGGSGDIVMKTQLSKTDCVKNKTWGETGDGVYVKGGCRAIFETMSMNPPESHGGGSGYSDLIGAKGAGGESELQRRGYTFARTTTQSNSKLGYWWKPNRAGCIQVTTSDGRYSAIRDVSTSQCGQR